MQVLPNIATFVASDRITKNEIAYQTNAFDPCRRPRYSRGGVGRFPVGGGVESPRRSDRAYRCRGRCRYNSSRQLPLSDGQQTDYGQSVLHPRSAHFAGDTPAGHTPPPYRRPRHLHPQNRRRNPPNNNLIIRPIFHLYLPSFLTGSWVSFFMASPLATPNN